MLIGWRRKPKEIKSRIAKRAIGSVPDLLRLALPKLDF